MTLRQRAIVFVSIAVVVVIVTVAYAVFAYRQHQATEAQGPGVTETDQTALAAGPRIVFRNTSIGSANGELAEVSAADPGGPRSFLDVTCDRVYATTDSGICLQTDAGVVTTFKAVALDSDWHQTSHWALPGIPSRTRLSPDGTLVATTTFVAGHSYMTTGFSTATSIRRMDGSKDYGNIEDFDVVVGGKPVTAADLNIWGVTFADDDNTFYATAGFSGQTWLVKGDLEARTLTGIHEGAECPSLSPDGKLVAYKKNIGGAAKHWAIGVYNLATGDETQLAETRSVDDQVEWLDDDTLLYGMPTDQTGVTDIWSIDITADAQPALFIEGAWSPSVIR